MTIELKINYLAPVAVGILTAEAKVVSGGTRIVVLESKVSAEDGTLVALATGSFYVSRKKDGGHSGSASVRLSPFGNGSAT